MIAVRDFLGAYEQSRKEPDMMIRPCDQLHPSAVVEVGWAESYPHLQRDMRLWIEGTREVNVVLVIKWTRSSSKVRGSIETWVRGANGAPEMRQSSVCVSLCFSLDCLQTYIDAGYTDHLSGATRPTQQHYYHTRRIARIKATARYKR